MTKARANMTDGKRERPDRVGQKGLALFVDPATHRAVNVLVAEQGTTSVAVMHEAIGLVLARHGKELPEPVVEHIKAHHRPMPPTMPKIKRKDYV
jgi:hypothetical protein